MPVAATGRGNTAGELVAEHRRIGRHPRRTSGASTSASASRGRSPPARPRTRHRHWRLGRRGRGARRRPDVAIGGSGDVDIRGGNAPDLRISQSPAPGDVNFGGVAGDLDVSIVGGGDVNVAAPRARLSRSIMGGGDVRIGS